MMKMQNVLKIRGIITVRCMLALCASLLLGVAVPQAAGQAPPGTESCLCRGVCTNQVDPVPIDNLNDKTADLVLCASDALPAVCQAIWANNNPVVVATVQQAIVAIATAYNANNPPVPLNVVVHGHGLAGVQCFGPGTECIGNFATPAAILVGLTTQGLLDKKELFVKGNPPKEGARGKIKDLILLGCSVADQNDGQGFLVKLKGELDADSVKGFTGTNHFDDWASTATACGTFPTCNGACPVGQVCAQTDTNNDQTSDACRCWKPTTEADAYKTEGDKKLIVPAVSEWGLCVMALLVVTAATVVIMRRRAAVA